MTLHRTLILAALAALPAMPTAAVAQPAQPAQPANPTPRAPAPAPAPEAPSDGLSPQDRDVLAAGQQLAAETSQVLEQWIITQAITEDRLFSRLYFPITKPKSEPQKFSTPYDALADRDLVGPEDKVLGGRTTGLQYAIVTDENGYVPAHNTRFAQALTGASDKDYVNNRTKRIFGDLASIIAARSVAKYLVQRVKLETGDTIYDLSVPIMVKGKHWGCVRIGYRRAE